MTELAQFHQFVAHKFQAGGLDLSPEECLDLWRAEHPSSAEMADSVAAIQRALAESGRGEGRPAADVVAELRTELGLPHVGSRP
jgi:hypothetical protein